MIDGPAFYLVINGKPGHEKLQTAALLPLCFGCPDEDHNQKKKAGCAGELANSINCYEQLLL